MSPSLCLSLEILSALLLRTVSRDTMQWVPLVAVVLLQCEQLMGEKIVKCKREQKGEIEMEQREEEKGEKCLFVG